VALIGRELREARRTGPLARARSLSNIDIHQKSFKAVDWMHFILCSGELLLAGRITSAFYKIFMAPSRACRLLFRPRGKFEANVQSIDNDLKEFVTNYYSTIYRGTAEWLPLCLSSISLILDIVPLIRACGPAWVVWQFPMERNIGTLGKRIRSSSRPHATLVKNITHKCKADVITSFGQQYTPTE